MNKIILILALLGNAISAKAETPVIQQVAVIPRPANLQMGTEPPVLLSDKTTIGTSNAETKAVAQMMSKEMTSITGKTTSVVKTSGLITLRLDPNMTVEGPGWRQNESYVLTSGSGHIEIAAHSPHGLFNGAQTLYQLLIQTPGGAWQVPAVKVIDQPRFRWRGMMLDVARHFFTTDEVRRFIDLMALHKYNIFHWHLTEDQGWRIEVKQYPKLTAVGAYRVTSPTMEDPNKQDGAPYGGFYTQDEIRAIVAYAADRFITVVPELEMPGHTTAVIASYPELGNTDIPHWAPPSVATTWGVIPNTLSPGEKTFQYLANIFDEVLPLFPGEYVHIGGDEAPKDQWKASPNAQAAMQVHHLKNEEELQSWFVQRIEKMLNQRGKRLVGWDEIQQGGLSPSATMMVWHDVTFAIPGLKQGNDVVMTPRPTLYFDQGQPQTPLTIPAFHFIGEKPVSMDQVYNYEPVPKDLPPDKIDHVLGAEGEVWTEYIWSQGKLEYMAWPRGCALSEVLWSPREGKDWNDYLQRLPLHEAFLDRFHVNYCRQDGNPAQPGQSMEPTSHSPPNVELRAGVK